MPRVPESLPLSLSRFQVCVHGASCVVCCWMWQGGFDRYGYGKVRYEGHQVASHRAIYQVINGVILQQKQLVLHTCDNRACCNWNHLYTGDSKKNVADAIERGRHIFHPENLSPHPENLQVSAGVNQTQAKLNDRKVRAARLLYTTGDWTQVELGELFGVSQSVMQRVLTGEDWKHVLS